jgi:DNA invertase Pin-like site-specific DNA recombinase
MKKAAIYARVSTKGQEASLETQLARCRDMAKARGFQVVHEASEIVSGAARHLPERNRAMKAARAGKFQALFVVRLDRWGRSTVDLLTTMQELEQLGVTFISIEDGIDLSTPTGRLQAEILASIATFERSLIQDRANEGREAARAKGKKFGRRPKLSTEQRNEAIRLLSLGMKQGEVAGNLQVHRMVVHRIAKELARNTPREGADFGPLFRAGEGGPEPRQD